MHPDRFAHKPELQKKADARMRRINNAYDALRTAERGTTIASDRLPGPKGNNGRVAAGDEEHRRQAAQAEEQRRQRGP